MKRETTSQLNQSKVSVIRLFSFVFAFLVCAMLAPNAFAQSKTVKGKITSSDDGSALPGVNIVIKGTSTGTTTDVEGNYSVNVPSSESVLVFSFIGFLPQEIAVGNQSTIDIKLASDVRALSEIVVVGYGEQKKSDITGAVAQITTKDFNAGVINNPMQAVMGRVAGLVVGSPNGDPTNNRPTIRLRGTSSLTANSEPLVVIDGVIGAPLNSVAPEDIEKMDILKDASSAAIYGSRGSNGVIIITTKKGKAGKAVITYNTYVGFENVAKFADLLTPDEFRQKAKEKNIVIQDLGQNTNWSKEITRQAISYNHSVSVGGGTDKSNYRASLTYLNQEGVTLGSGYDRLNARLVIGQKALNDKLDMQFLVTANTEKKNFIQYDAFRSAFRANPTLPVYNADGTFYQPSGFEIENPVARVNQLSSERRDKQFLANAKFFYEVIPGLKLGVNGSYSIYGENFSGFTPSAYTGFGNRLSSASRGFREVKDRLIEATAAYNKTFDKHSIQLLAGYTYQLLSDEGFSASNRDFPDVFGANSLGSGEFNTDGSFLGSVGSYRSEAKLDGVLGRAIYNYDGKYSVTVNFRRDGSSRFGTQNRYGIFPSVAAGWTISEEAFMKSVTFINFLKLRVGYGVTGNQDGIADYASRALYGPRGKFFSNGAYRNTYNFTQNANPDLKWEQSAMTNIGVDFGFMEGKIKGSIEFYNKDTRDLLFNYPISLGSRYGSQNLTAVTGNILTNVGSVNNRGIEFSLDYLVVDKDDFTWTSTLNFAHNRNKIVSLSNDNFKFPPDGITVQSGFGTGQGGLQNPSWIQEGYPIGQFRGAEFIGFNDKGEFQYRNDKGVLVNDASQAALVPIGNAQPTLTFGWGNSFSYKSFDLSFFFRGNLGQKIANGPDIVFGNPTLFPNNNVLRSSFEAPYAGITQPPQFSSLYVQDGSFVRLDNFNLGYKLPLKNTLIKNVRLYVSGQNLFVITKYKGIDPELATGGQRDVYGNSDQNLNLAPGVNSISFYPRTRTFSFGLSVTF